MRLKAATKLTTFGGKTVPMGMEGDVIKSEPARTNSIYKEILTVRWANEVITVFGSPSTTHEVIK